MHPIDMPMQKGWRTVPKQTDQLRELTNAANVLNYLVKETIKQESAGQLDWIGAKGAIESLRLQIKTIALHIKSAQEKDNA